MGSVVEDECRLWCSGPARSAWRRPGICSKAGHDVTVVERQDAAALETSWGNGGVIHASEVEPWSQPGMPLKILKWLGQENAPLLLRYGAIPHMWRWGLAFARNCTPEKFAANSRANLELALYSLRSLQEIGGETGIAYDRATNGVLKIYRSKESLDNAARACDVLARHRAAATSASTSRAASSSSRRSTRPPRTLAGALYFERDEVGDCNKFTQGLAGGVRGARRALPLWDDGQTPSRLRKGKRDGRRRPAPGASRPTSSSWRSEASRPRCSRSLASACRSIR